MPVEVVLPALSAGMEDAVIARWLKAEGDAVSKGDLIAEVETDKATMELEAEVDGRIGQLLVKDGARANVNQVIALLLKEGEDASAIAGFAVGSSPVAVAEAEAPVAASPVPAAPAVSAPASGEVRHRASPLARRLAAELGVSLEGLAGSGARGRIVRIDVERAAASKPVPVAAAAAPVAAPAEASSKAIPVGIGEYEAVPHTSMRRTIARRLLEAKTTVPHFYLNVDCEIDALLALRSQINEKREGSTRISVNDFVIKASAAALRRVPDANVIWTDEALLKLKDVDIAVAVATEGGLITPIIRSADQMSLGAISAQMKSLAARARENRLKPEEFQGGGFSISNLGMYGVKSFSAIINPPQSAILAVGAGERRPIERNGELAFATMMSVTLSVDHRAVDGALGAQLLAAFKAGIEDPMSLLV
ncbi:MULTISPECIES: pyruvate dehydrogenase complex dihydrolipoamide acetyltransferase [unclassified Brucella]|uniref:pyruvate dehydrogenase complex dihydrolipoamide acetyltransferase n=1 Tax=unclassified Brucella TaxID=2632610 RepID=UPI0012AE0209|nr:MULTISPECIES: pyruvate dehydrogenase complex dihydrolipoamide acetyltransferase [unclassified Brucella]MRN43261.1 pyruvate dehydrogenase complex dihydrolipoamide acetyltransferase [Brucella sp. 09RB8913]MRN58577.1 pyruvate dehydrogenase complex dihydrolipoamide acetyltransferase [Brucella sp. 09RB8918]CAB4326439.1 dihydrolipoamide acetyltransferase [Brucella sp. 191011898]